MSLVACRDKRRKQRVQASGNLPRVDYFCPNSKCDAVMILVDCNDEIRKDHFRLKTGYQHVKNCPYANDEIYLLDNGFTYEECQIIKEAINRLYLNLSKLQVELINMSNDSSDSIVYKSFKYWLGYDLNRVFYKNRVLGKIKKLSFKISKYEANKFLYSAKEGVVGHCNPWQSSPIYLTNIFFDNNIWDNVKQEGTLVHEALHQIFKMNDFKTLSRMPILKRYYAENWASCYEEIVRELWEK